MKVKHAVLVESPQQPRDRSVKLSYCMEDEEDGKPVERYIDGELFPSKEMAASVLLDRGWSYKVANSNFYPPTIPGALVGINAPVATASLGAAGTPPAMPEGRALHIGIMLHWTRHASMGRCFGFSFWDMKHPVGTVLFDPVFNLVFGGLVAVECIGHWLSRDSAVHAARDFYTSVRGAYGPKFFDLAIELCLRREYERREE